MHTTEYIERKIQQCKNRKLLELENILPISNKNIYFRTRVMHHDDQINIKVSEIFHEQEVDGHE